MRQIWNGSAWELQFADDRVVLTTGAGEQTFVGTEAERLDVVRRWFRWQLRVDAGVQRFKGIRRDDARELRDRLQHFRTRAGLQTELADALEWSRRVETCFAKALVDLRWIPHDDIEDLIDARPDHQALRGVLDDEGFIDSLPWRESVVFKTLKEDLQGRRGKINEQILYKEIARQKEFLSRIEKSPLTDEQARAVVCFDNRVQVIAAAGSGKTSVMVARAAYAVKRGFVPANRILVLAFNKTAAAELQERIDLRLKANGIDPTGLKATTFHSFGLSLLGKARGEKPRLAPWLEGDQELQKVEQLIDQLRDSSHEFRYKWDLYRLLFARTSDTPEGGDPEWWDPETKVSGHRTLNGETVRSQGEKLVADWLFLNGVRYEYERPYVYPVADAEHSQYRPDFFYPDIDVWHEHWALDREGEPPAEFKGYADGMAWKKRLHQEYGTTLVETTWAEIIDRSGFAPLEHQLIAHGQHLDWNPDRPLPAGVKAVEHRELATLVRSFMAHVKSNSLDRQGVLERLARNTMLGGYRTRLFLDIYWRIHAAWEEALRAEGCVDFEDMLVQAAEALEANAVSSHYDLVLVDEFQDSSAARARLVKALVGDRGRFLLTVGDDWQSIYRFAGADVSVMTGFEEWFGPSEQLRLQTTFRSTQAITDAAGAFVSKNPRQLAKKVRAAQGPGGVSAVLMTVTPEWANKPDADLRAAVTSYLHHIAGRLERGEIEPGRGGRVSIDVLGRYRFEKDLLPERWPDTLDVTFRTVHRAKGLEADYVLLPRMVRGTVGFPSQIENDPVLDLVMADPDPFPFGEERRLFYVAMTRARREVAMLTVAGKESPFVVEMLKDGRLRRVDAGSDEAGAADPALAVCPTCEQGLLVKRQGKYGEFWGCSRFPACRHTRRVVA